MLIGKAVDLVDRYDVRHSMDVSEFAAIKRFKLQNKGDDAMDTYLQDDTMPLSNDIINQLEIERYQDLTALQSQIAFLNHCLGWFSLNLCSSSESERESIR